MVSQILPGVKQSGLCHVLPTVEAVHGGGSKCIAQNMGKKPAIGDDSLLANKSLLSSSKVVFANHSLPFLLPNKKVLACSKKAWISRS